MQDQYDGFTIVKGQPDIIELKPLGAVASKRILGYCPTYRLEPETAAALLGQQWTGGYDVLFGRDNPYPVDDGGRANILRQYNHARDIMLQGRYDALFIVECDVIPPKDALERLAVLPADIAYGEYLFRRPYRQSFDGDLLYNVNVQRHVIGPYPDESMSLHEDEWYETFGKVCRCTGSGLGIVLIWRQVLEKIQFAYGDNSHCDTRFTQDAHQAGYTMMADRSVRCGHKQPDGTILWPANQPGYALMTHGITEGYRGELKDDPTKL